MIFYLCSYSDFFMGNGIRTSDMRGFNKGRSSKFHEDSRVWQIPEEVRRTYRPKRYGNNNKDEDSSPKTIYDKNQQASSQKFRQQTPDEGRRTHRPKRCGNNNKDEDNSPKPLNNKNHQASSRNFDSKYLKKAGGHIGQNVVEITTKMKIIVRKHLMIKMSLILFAFPESPFAQWQDALSSWKMTSSSPNQNFYRWNEKIIQDFTVLMCIYGSQIKNNIEADMQLCSPSKWYYTSNIFLGVRIYVVKYRFLVGLRLCQVEMLLFWSANDSKNWIYLSGKIKIIKVKCPPRFWLACIFGVLKSKKLIHFSCSAIYLVQGIREYIILERDTISNCYNYFYMQEFFPFYNTPFYSWYLPVLSLFANTWNRYYSAF